MICQVEISELFAVWEYKGKYKSKKWGNHCVDVLNARLSSPPVKMIRSLPFVARETALPHIQQPVILESLPAIHPGKTSDIPFNPMEAGTDTRVKATQADDVEVDLSQWTYCMAHNNWKPFF